MRIERPRALGDKAFFTEQEAAERDKSILADVSTDRRDGPAEVDVNRSYNELWRERGHLLLRTSLIVDPPDGRLPPLTPGGLKRETARPSSPAATTIIFRSIKRAIPS